jgi:hydrogenase-4 component E
VPTWSSGWALAPGRSCWRSPRTNTSSCGAPAAVATGLAILFARTLPLADEHAGSLLVPASLATVLSGFIILTTRLKAITQVAGYLILENGIFIMGLTLVEAMPFLVEVGVLLDLVVAIFVMGIMIYRINREFSSLDTTHLTTLKEE